MALKTSARSPASPSKRHKYRSLQLQEPMVQQVGNMLCQQNESLQQRLRSRKLVAYIKEHILGQHRLNAVISNDDHRATHAAGKLWNHTFVHALQPLVR